MVFSIIHWLPSALAAILIILLAFVKKKPYHKILGILMMIFAVIGLFGYITEANSFQLTALNFHTIHAWLGIVTLVLSITVFGYRMIYRKKQTKLHCELGHIAAALAAISLILGVFLISGLSSQQTSGPAYSNNIQYPASSKLPEIEATSFNGTALVPISDQGNNAIKGTQYINRSAYRLHVYGLVKNELNVSYNELLDLPAYSEVSYMPCVEGWGFMAKWTGFRVNDLLNLSGIKPEATYVVFYSSDGYSTGLPLDYIEKNNILLAYGINDLTLPAERGFPLQLVANQKYGYKWAKWVMSIELVDKEEMGYWESRGYSNSADVGTFALS